MANLINLDRVSKGYGPAGQLLNDVSIGLDETDRVGVVGLNGAGKSTLLRLLARAAVPAREKGANLAGGSASPREQRAGSAGDGASPSEKRAGLAGNGASPREQRAAVTGGVRVEEPDSGRVTHRRDLRVSMLTQSLELDPDATVREIVLGSGFAAEHEWAGDAGIRNILDGLGMSGLGLDEKVGTMSGGERRRVSLAALLIREADVLILDEPTNHLDLAGVSWLASWLNQHWRGALVVVTHDRWFLDAVCNHIWEVADLQVRSYEGGYAAWVLARAERERVAAGVEARRQNLLRKEIAWLRRGPPARTSKPKFRIDAANALIADVPPARDQVTLAKLATARLGRQVFDLEDVTVHAGSKLILSHVSWHAGPGDRIALLGANGAGKSTLLRLLAGITTAPGVTIGKTVKPAFLSQELTELGAPGSLRLLEAVEQVARRVRLGDRELTAAQLAEIFGFTDRRVWTPVSDLSGGERRRLQMLRLLAAEPNVLLLDEPTNDLDTDTLAALEDLLDSWPGTMIVASHDRYLVERVCESVYALPGDGSLRHLPGGVDEYLSLTIPAAIPATAARLSKVDPRTAKRDLARMERQLEKLAQREEKLHAQMAEHATDFAKITELDDALKALALQKAALEEEWLVLADELA